ncbi:MAG: hypothetical protein KBH99_02275 [Syntrophobacteraceae bacterium]|nr:hypothetical protein [Syntrophobacteraceae bacterium]
MSFSAMIFVCSLSILVGAILVAYGFVHQPREREAPDRDFAFPRNAKVPMDEPVVLDFKEEFSSEELMKAEFLEEPGRHTKKSKRPLREIVRIISTSVRAGLKKAPGLSLSRSKTSPPADLDRPSPRGTVIGTTRPEGSTETFHREG